MAIEAVGKRPTKLNVSPFSQQERLDRWVVGVVSLFVWLVFSLRDLLILVLGDWSHVYGVVGVSILRWEEVICYLPLAE